MEEVPYGRPPKSFVYGTAPGDDMDDDVKLRVIKAVLCGQESVGKTSILTRLHEHRFTNNVDHTIGVQFVIHMMTTLDGKSVKLQCWDTAGQERFRTMIKNYFKKVHVILFVFDISDRGSFDSLEYWIKESGWHRKADGDYACIHSKYCIAYIVGNKLDMAKHRKVQTEEGTLYAKRYGMDYFEMSAQTGACVDEAFSLIAEHACKLDKLIAVETNGKEALFQQTEQPVVVEDGDYQPNQRKTRGCCFCCRKKHIVI
jgi:small GTP-binding protein